jgi:hypothetical protein
MKIDAVKPNNHRKAFEVKVGSRNLLYPYAKLDLRPGRGNGIVEVCVDGEIGDEGFTYLLESGDEGTVHVEQVLEYNEDPGYLTELLIYRLTLEAQKRVEESPLSKREIIRRLGTSATQFYRLLDQTNYRKSIGQIVSLLHLLDCDVDLVVQPRQRA